VMLLLALRRFLMGTLYYCRQAVGGPGKMSIEMAGGRIAQRIRATLVHSQRIRCFCFKMHSCRHRATLCNRFVLLGLEKKYPIACSPGIGVRNRPI
jgi:hypothetical protein